MTVDDNSSIYVGGLPYDITDEALRRVFYVYGAVVAIKIINDRAVGGRCYGFVTFANPRSATQAIREMDGKTIDGRIVRVNDVRTRGGKSNFNRESSGHIVDRSINDGRGRDRGRDDYYDRQRHQDAHRERSHEEYNHQNRERGNDRMRVHDRSRDRYVDEERFQDYNRNLADVEQEHQRKRKRDWERDGDKISDQQRNNNHRMSRELSMESLNDDQDQIQGESNLAVTNQKLEELRNEISQMEELVADKQEVVSKLQEKYQKMEDSLISAKKLTSRRQMQLAKLHKCYLKMKDYDERFKKSEQELQWLVDSTMIELESDDAIGDGILANGRA